MRLISFCGNNLYLASILLFFGSVIVLCVAILTFVAMDGVYLLVFFSLPMLFSILVSWGIFLKALLQTIKRIFRS